MEGAWKDQYVAVAIFDDVDLRAHAHFGLVDTERVRPECKFRVKIITRVKELKENHIARAFNVSNPDKIRLRYFSSR